MTAFCNYRKSEIAGACLDYGSLLKDLLATTDDGFGRPIDGAQLLFAIAGVESSFGANCEPRLEWAYLGGKYESNPIMQDLIAQYSEDAAKSYGPWQVMLCNAYGYSPRELGMRLDSACMAAVGFLRRYVLQAKRARTLDQIADTYNSGNWKDKNVPAQYIANLRLHYVSEVIARPLATPKGEQA